jgi:hypothetical protein
MTQQNPTNEKVALDLVLQGLDARGWKPTALWDSEETIKVPKEWDRAKLIEEAAAVEMASITLKKDEARGQIMLCWGNSPSELIYDNTTNHGFDEDLHAVQVEIWPSYPDVD